MKIKPFSDRVVLRRNKPEETTKGGIILAESAQSQSLTCEVLAVGPGRVTDQGARIEIDVRPGDVVLIASKYAGNEIEVDGKRYLVVRADEIAGALE